MTSPMAEGQFRSQNASRILDTSHRSKSKCQHVVSTSKLRTARRARERDHVADVGHAGDELHGALQAQAEAGVGDGAVAAEVEIPPVVFRVEVLLAPCAASSTSSRSSRWLPPMISPTLGTSTSIARTVLPSSLTRM